VADLSKLPNVPIIGAARTQARPGALRSVLQPDGPYVHMVDVVSFLEAMADDPAIPPAEGLRRAAAVFAAPIAAGPR
jgi:hypothetical protein